MTALAVNLTPEDYLWLIGGVGLIVLGVAGWFIARIVFKARIDRSLSSVGTETMAPGELKKLEKRGLLTPEELRLVQAATARQFMERQREIRERPTAPTGLSGEKMLELVAEKIELEVRTGLPKTAPEPPPPPFPPHLLHLREKSEADLRDLAAAGFLSEEDLREVLSFRGVRA
jgi:hypothetical protein